MQDLGLGPGSGEKIPAVVYIKHKDNVAVSIPIQVRDPKSFQLVQNISNIGGLIGAFFPKADSTELGQYKLRLPNGVTRSASGLEKSSFLNSDGPEDDTALRPGLMLSKLGEHGKDDLSPLVVNFWISSGIIFE